MPTPRDFPVIPVEQDPLLPSTHRYTASDERGYQRIRLRQDILENWLKNDPILASGEFAYVIAAGDPGQMLKIGDGSLRFSQLPYLMQTGNSGPPGPVGPPGGNMALAIQATEPDGSPSLGDIWLQPVSATSANLYLWNGWDWISVSSSGGSGGTVNTTYWETAVFGYPNLGSTVYVLGGPFVVPTSLTLSYDENYSVSEYLNQLDYALVNGDIVRRGGQAVLYNLQVGENSGFRKDLTVGGVLRVSGGIRYGGTVAPITRGDPKNGPDDLDYQGGFELPLPTEDGFLRSDADDNNWYFSEPVIVSDIQPPDPKVKGTLWVYPDGQAITTAFSNANPPVYADAPVAEQPNGLPIGLSPDGMEIHQPYMVGGVPVMVGGKRYLLPLIEAPTAAPGADPEPAPLFSYADQPITQQLDGTIIGLSPDGMEITQPYFVGGIYVMVGGKKYLLPLIEE